MKKYKILVITDHHTHGRGESIYELLKTMSKFSCCQEIFVATRGDLSNKGFFTDFNQPTIHAKKVDHEFCYSDNGQWFSSTQNVIISDFDVLFLRIDRPITDEQLKIIGRNFRDLLIINDPNGIIETGSKRFLLNFPELCPEISICHTMEEVHRQLHLFPIVLKPLYGYGGVGLVRIDAKNVYIEDNLYSFKNGMSLVKDYLEHSGAMLSMKFLENFRKGDKRIVVVGGQILGATLRLPANNSWLCNLKQGGSASFADIDDSELEIASKISPVLNNNGVLIFGFDTLEDDNGVRRLSEINTLNVGGLLQAEEFSKRPVIENAATIIWEYIKNNSITISCT